MKFIESPLSGAFIIEFHKHEDSRGYFARTYCYKEFQNFGLHSEFVQSNISFNARKGTLRGMHFQVEPFAEIKIVSCFRGEIFDVIVDLRPDSKTFSKSFGININDEGDRALYIPKGFAHGFQTLQDNSLVHYQMGTFYNPSHAHGIRWNDPFLNIKWPLSDITLSEKDKSYSDFKI
jgi:dTDP-4-dehydrorhamnose 3,5-epimerase